MKDNINPYDQHPENGCYSKPIGQYVISIDQLNAVVEKIAGRVATSPPKTWGFQREEVVEKLWEVVREASNTASSESNKGGS